MALDLGITFPQGTDENVKVSANDETAGFLLSKIKAGTNISINEINDGGVEKLEIVSTGGGGGNTIYTSNDALTGNRIIAGATFDLTFDNVGTFKVENVGSIIFDDTANINFVLQRSGTTLFSFDASSPFNAQLAIGGLNTDVSASLNMKGTTGAILVNRMDTTARNLLTAVNGMILYNTTLGAFEFREGGAWVTGSGLT